MPMLLPLLAAATALVPQQFVEWHGGAARYAGAGVTVVVTPQPCRTSGNPCGEDEVRPRVTITMRGAAPYSFATPVTTPKMFPLRFAIGRLDARDARPSVLFSQFTGGAHCCEQVIAMVPAARGWQRVDLGEWDMAPLKWPRDVSGDGVADFIFPDGRFNYAFASYAESMAPPRVFNIVAGRKADVSARAGFAPVFRTDMAKTRALCVKPERQMSPNGACAAYVADAARLGRFDAAWAVAMKSYDRKAVTDGITWLPDGCRVARGKDGACPKAATITYKTYPEALRAFLIDTGYPVSR